MCSFPSVDEIARKASDAAFGNPLVMNVWRGHVVEAIIAAALPEPWHWCSSDWASWDFEHPAGIRLEVKQSAARQSWSTGLTKSRSPAFDIAARTGYWDQSGNWIEAHGRAADVYVFAYHPRSDALADHRDPRQWEFYVLRASSLPEQRTVTLQAIKRLSEPVSFEELRRVVEECRDEHVSSHSI